MSLEYQFESMPEFSDNSPIDVARLNAIIRNLNSLNRYLRFVASRVQDLPPLIDDPTNPNPNPTDPGNPGNPGTPNPNQPAPGVSSGNRTKVINLSWDDKGKLQREFLLSGIGEIKSMDVVIRSVTFRPDGSSSGTRKDMLNKAVSIENAVSDISDGSFTYKFVGNNLNTSNKYQLGIDYPKSYKNVTITLDVNFTYIPNSSTGNPRVPSGPGFDTPA